MTGRSSVWSGVAVLAALALAAGGRPAVADVLGSGVKGAAGGAVLGAVFGGGSEGAKRGAKIGAAIGVLKGAAEAEKRRDAQDARERERLRIEQERLELERQQAAEAQRVREAAAPAATAQAPSPQLVTAAQNGLKALGYLPEEASGRMTKGTVEAVREYQRDQGLEPTGRVTPALLDHIRASGG
jgi:hypothetical protein